MIPSIRTLLFLALPIGWAEWAMARHGGTNGFHNGAAILGVAGRGHIARYFGVLAILIPMVVYMGVSDRRRSTKRLARANRNGARHAPSFWN
jgi:hypothetical protein